MLQIKLITETVNSLMSQMHCDYNSYNCTRMTKIQMQSLPKFQGSYQVQQEEQTCITIIIEYDTQEKWVMLQITGRGVLVRGKTV